MNDMFVFERPAWELLVDALPAGSTLPAVRLLTALEQEDDSAVQDAFDALLHKNITVDISALPPDYGAGEMEKRLRWEQQLACAGQLLPSLEASDPLRLYLEELGGIPAQGDPELLKQQYLDGDDSAAQKLSNLYLHKAVSAAEKNTGRGVLLLDLIQEASLGLWQGILEYSGGDFEAHIDWWIAQSIARVVILQARESGVVQSMRARMEAFQTADRQLLTQLGRNATLEEIALEMGIDPEQAEVVQDMIRSARTMQKVKEEPTREDPEEQQSVEDTAYFQSRQRIAEMLSGLSETEAQLLTLRFGLEGGVPASPESVGAKLGMTADAVVAMEAAALAKLRKE